MAANLSGLLLCYLKRQQKQQDSPISAVIGKVADQGLLVDLTLGVGIGLEVARVMVQSACLAYLAHDSLIACAPNLALIWERETVALDEAAASLEVEQAVKATPQIVGLPAMDQASLAYGDLRDSAVVVLEQRVAEAVKVRPYPHWAI